MFTVNPKRINYLTTSRGVAFTAELLKNGKAIGTIENQGNGGWTRSVVDNEHQKDIDTAAVELAELANRSTVNCNEWYLNHLIDIAENINEFV